MSGKEAPNSHSSFLQNLIDNIPTPVFYKDSNGLYLGCNKAFENYIGLTREKLMGKSVFDVAPKELAEKYNEKDDQLFKNPGNQIYEALVQYADGSYHDVIFNKATFNADDGNLGGLVGVVLDISNLKKTEKALWQEKEKALVTLQSIGDAVITTDNTGIIESMNPIAEELTGWTILEAKGMPLNKVFKIINEETGKKAENPAVKSIREGRIVGLANHTVLIHRDGHQFAIEDSAAPIRNSAGQIIGTIMVFHDVSEKRKLLQQMMHQAHHDVLTELPNRLLLNDRLKLAIAQARQKGDKLALMFLDLDRFKLINDMLGHAEGDNLLKLVAQRIKGCIRESDTLARLGGDEFTILLPQIANEEEAAKIAQNILHEFKSPFMLGFNEYHVTASIGIAIFPNDGEDVETLMKHADTAMFRAKEQGRNNYQLFTPDMNAKIIERMTMEGYLRHALEYNELMVCYQPQVNINSGLIEGMEALVRWHHPIKGMVPPSEFIPLAEDNGMIIPIGEWVLRTACFQNKQWQDQGYGPLKVTVNLSGCQIQQPNFIKTISQILRETGLKPHMLELEITESVAMQDIEATIATLRQIRSMGVQLALDDFGTGYSSLSYLKKFPIQTLKIDRSFVRDISIDREEAAIVSTIIAMAKILNLKVVAEGVETEEQLRFLYGQQCYKMQGFLFSRPLIASEFEKLISSYGNLSKWMKISFN